MTKRFGGKLRAFAFLLPLIMALALSCAQDSIFSGIAAEQEPKDPRIAGTPANIVAIGNAVYAASIGSGTIHKYEGGWSTFGSNGGRVIGLASDGTDLYALTGGDRMNASLKKYPVSGETWSTIGKGDAEGFSLQYIYGAGERLFAGGSQGGNWKVFYTDGAADLQEVPDMPANSSSQLSGAAADGSGNFYIATFGNGIFITDLLSGTAQVAAGAQVTGILNVNGVITAVTRGGQILAYDGSDFIAISTGGPNYTGGMSIWKEYINTGTEVAPAGVWESKLLLLGMQSRSSYSKGYREIELDSAGKPFMPPIHVEVNSPGSIIPSSVALEDRKKYDASIARYSVFHILQVPREPVIFASTANNGLQSLRGGLWNAEE
ncbi:putative lipoprotein [Leadbettera azotonutricia]|uniref:Putative lipoprotein n=1 Tax=Leadbettera azotonutricia (strain ATCC BAA-888 / DSM 13862 / ZAS-9) TaxID=545695 RepID=F5YDH9_LEAAZ|nr:putative lipoprotein [Leadbettera azotonutricia]AEF82708.1 putative lipoprotein [Leadbettera azotonutricia ZAS-9]